MVQTAEFWDKSAERYAKSAIRDEAAYQEKLKITQGYFKPDMQVLEIACGTGTTAIAHAPYVKHILAIDISSKILEIAQHKANAENLSNISFEQSTVEEFKATDQSFDVVMGHNILHLLDNPGAAVSKVYGLLKPGGVFVTTTACLGDSKSWWRIALPIGIFFRKIPYVNILTRKDLEGHFSNAGFEIDYQWERRKKQAAFIIARKPSAEIQS
jgi:ubiquinone/menaquinone biosynthesis C-methylase UbiE